MIYKMQLLSLTIGLMALSLSACGLSPSVSQSNEGIVGTPADNPADGEVTLRSAATAAELNWGAAVLPGLLTDDPRYATTLNAQFNTLTFENHTKFEVLQPQPGVFDFSEANQVADFARAHGIKVRGHVLVWHHQLPGWVKNGTFTREELIEVMETHINTVMTYFRDNYSDVVIHWDVVNEAYEADGSRRLSIWQQVIGDDYIELAFQFAHAAWPEAKLFYNDFYENTFVTVESTQDLDGNPQLTRPKGPGATPGFSDCSLVPKCAAAKAMFEDFIDRGIPVHGWGLQAHIANAASPDFSTLTSWVGGLGLEWALTEIDRPCPVPPGSSADPLCLENQAMVFEMAAAACLDDPACNTVVQWGVTDRYSWWDTLFGGGALTDPLVISDDYTFKPAADRLLALFQQYEVTD